METENVYAIVSVKDGSFYATKTFHGNQDCIMLRSKVAAEDHISMFLKKGEWKVRKLKVK